MKEGDDPGRPQPPERPGLPLTLADDLLRILRVLVLGAVGVNLSMVVACRLPGAPPAMAPVCADAVPMVREWRERALETVVTLMAGAGMAGMSRP